MANIRYDANTIPPEIVESVQLGIASAEANHVAAIQELRDRVLGYVATAPTEILLDMAELIASNEGETM